MSISIDYVCFLPNVYIFKYKSPALLFYSQNQMEKNHFCSSRTVKIRPAPEIPELTGELSLFIDVHPNDGICVVCMTPGHDRSASWMD